MKDVLERGEKLGQAARQEPFWDGIQAATQLQALMTEQGTLMILEKKAELIREQMDAFPILPVTVVRIMEVTSNPESSANDLMQALLPDQSLCVTVLKLANSVLFGRPQRVDSLTTAIMVLGFKEVQSIALIKAIVNSFRELQMNNAAALEQFWVHSFHAAMAAKYIAHDLRFSPNTFFMAGLIHDIGKLVMLLTFGAE